MNHKRGKRSSYLIRDLLILSSVLIFLLGLSLGLVRLLRGGGRSKPATEARPLELHLKNLIRGAILEEDPILDDSRFAEAFELIEARLVQAWLAGNGEYEVEILVLDSPLVNAVTFPGGLIVVHRGLVDRLQSAEEMAAVVAHELGHVAHRDPIRQLRRKIGLSLFFAFFGGRRTEVFVRRLIQEAIHLRYTRSVESAADRFALQLLAEAGIDPASLGRALERLQEESEGELPVLMKYLDGHPDIEARVEAAYSFAEMYKGSADTGAAWTDLPIDWDELKQSLPDRWD